MTVSIEEGDLLATRSLGAGVVAAWQESGVIAGYTQPNFGDGMDKRFYYEICQPYSRRVTRCGN